MALLRSGCFSAAFSSGWVFQGQWRDLSQGLTSSSHGSPAAPSPQLGLHRAHPSGRTTILIGKTTLEVEGCLGGKTLLPAHGLLQMPFAESFKTESDQLRFANERPDGWGGGAGGKEPHGLRQQVASRRWDEIYAPGRAVAPLPLLV